MRAVGFLLIPVLAVAAHAADARIDDAVAGLAAQDPRIRVAAVQRLGACGRRPECVRAVRALERSLFDAEPTVRRASCNALATLDARAATGSVRKLLALERDPQVTCAALVCLGRLRASDALVVFVHYASDPRPSVRAAAVTGAGDLGGVDARRLIANSLQMAGREDTDWTVRAAALLALAHAGRAEDLAVARRAYVQGRGDRYWFARSAWARLVAALDPRPRIELERLLMDPDARVAVTAATSLVRVGLGDLVLVHLRHSQAEARVAAIGGVRQTKLQAAYPRLRSMARFDPSRRVRWAAIVALFAVNDPAGDELMLDALRSDEPAIWTEALARIAHRTGGGRHGRDVKAWRAELKRVRQGRR